MYTIRTLNNIAKTGLAKLPEQNFVIDEKAENPEGIILRSFDMHKMELTKTCLPLPVQAQAQTTSPLKNVHRRAFPYSIRRGQMQTP